MPSYGKPMIPESDDHRTEKGGGHGDYRGDSAYAAAGQHFEGVLSGAVGPASFREAGPTSPLPRFSPSPETRRKDYGFLRE